MMRLFWRVLAIAALALMVCGNVREGTAAAGDWSDEWLAAQAVIGASAGIDVHDVLNPAINATGYSALTFAGFLGISASQFADDQRHPAVMMTLIQLALRRDVGASDSRVYVAETLIQQLGLLELSGNAQIDNDLVTSLLTGELATTRLADIKAAAQDASWRGNPRLLVHVTLQAATCPAKGRCTWVGSPNPLSFAPHDTIGVYLAFNHQIVSDTVTLELIGHRNGTPCPRPHSPLAMVGTVCHWAFTPDTITGGNAVSWVISTGCDFVPGGYKRGAALYATRAYQIMVWPPRDGPQSFKDGIVVGQLAIRVTPNQAGARCLR